VVRYLLVAVVSLVLGVLGGRFVRIGGAGYRGVEGVDGYIRMSSPLLFLSCCSPVSSHFPCLSCELALNTNHHNSTAPFGSPLVPSTLQHDVVWRENTTFSQSPTPESERAWDDWIPMGRGFVIHDTLAPKCQKSVSVFHELHCLVGFVFTFPSLHLASHLPTSTYHLAVLPCLYLSFTVLLPHPQVPPTFTRA